MTMYRDIYQDLPARVYEVWTQNRDATGSLGDLSVTIMLMAAATGLAMPWESLKDVGVGNGNTWNRHPSFVQGDQSHYQEVLKKCDQFLSKKIADNPSLQTAGLYQCNNLSEICSATEFSNTGRLLAPDQHNVRCIIRVLRNALAHNNIIAFGSSDDQIHKLGFFSEKKISSGCSSAVDSYLLVTITPEALQEFLDAWFHMLRPEKK